MKKNIQCAVAVLSAAAIMGLDSLATWKLTARKYERAASAPAYRESAQDPMERFRLEREQLRARQEAQLNDIIHASGAEADIVAQAQTQLLALLSGEQAELTLEGILRSRGFKDAIVNVSAGSCNVLIRGEALTQRETAVILESVTRETGLTGGNVKIIPVK